MLVLGGRSSTIHTALRLKTICFKLLHITPMLHALDLVTEAICKCYPDVDTIITQTKAAFYYLKWCLADAIRRFQTNSLCFADSLPILTDLELMSHQLNDEKSECIKKKLNSVINANFDFIKLKEFYSNNDLILLMQILLR